MSEAVLERLKSGIRRFQFEVHAGNAEDYRRLGSTQQQPHTLIIARADSRVDVEVLTSSGPSTPEDCMNLEVGIEMNLGRHP